MLIATLANAHRDEKTEAYEAKDFMLGGAQEPEEEQSDELIEMLLRQWTAGL
jgi:hypothetical protein